jgi:hypothetical protein
MKKNIWLICFHLFIFSFCTAQYRDTIHHAFTSSKTMDGRYESKNSFTNGERIEVVSFKLGVTFGKKVSIGGGYAYLNSPLKNNNLLPSLSGSISYEKNSFSFRYLCYYVDFIFHKNKRWQLSSQVEFGAGLSKFERLSSGNKNTKAGNPMFLYNPAINIKFKLLKWLGAGATIGYRFMLMNETKLGRQFNSPLYSAGILIWWDELALAVFPRSAKINKLLGPSEW